MATLDLIPETEVTMEKLKSLFDQSFFVTAIDEDGDLAVSTADSRVYLDVRPAIKLIGYSMYYSLNSSASGPLALALANRVNDSLVMVRFSLLKGEPHTMVADYHLSFEGGVLPFQIVSTLRTFTGIATRAIREYDEDNLMD